MEFRSLRGRNNLFDHENPDLPGCWTEARSMAVDALGASPGLRRRKALANSPTIPTAGELFGASPARTAERAGADAMDEMVNHPAEFKGLRQTGRRKGEG
jgi:hypothetical protein